MLGLTVSLICLALIYATDLNEQQKAPEHCKEAQQWPLNGRALVRDYRGRVLLMTFVAIKKCDAECELTLSRLDSLNEKFPSVRVLAVAPEEEPAADVRAFAYRFPRIRFEHEHKKSPIWRWFDANQLDQFVFDRCSRHSTKLASNFTTKLSPPSFAESAEALRQALEAQPCGPCEYDWAKPAPKWPSLHPPVPMKKHQQHEIMVINVGNLLTAFSREIGSPKDHSGAQRQAIFVEFLNIFCLKLAFVEQRPTGSNFQQNARNGRLQYGEQRGQAVHAYPAGSQVQQQQNQQQRMQQTSAGQLEQQQLLQKQQRDELIRQQQAERERLLREREEQLRQRQLLEEQHRRYWADRQQREQQQQQVQNVRPFSPQEQPQNQHQQHQHQQHLPQNPPGGSPQESQNQQAHRNQPAPVQYAKDPYGDRYQFGLGQGRTGGNQKIMRPPQQQRQRQPQQMPQQQQMLPIPPSNNAMPPMANVPSAANQFQPIAVPEPTAAGLEPAPLYPEGSETDYYGYDDEWTTEMPSALQIPKPTKPTTPTTPSIQQIQQQDKNFGFELPCTGFSDESCFQQQTQLRPNEVHRCCRGRILFTDQCIQGKCSNMTTQLCCIQRFLQAKLTCCSDERQAETSVGDHFSHCCFDNFVDSDDPCCPRDYAAEQWRSVHELCLPNVEMDLSGVKVPVPLLGTSLITEYDFGKTDKWRFECRYGGHVQQYSYFEASEENADEEKGGGGELDE